MRKAINADVKRMDERTAWLREAIEGLAKDVVELDEGQDDLINWANVCVDNYNAALNDIDENFSTLDNRCTELDEKIENVDNAGMYLFRFLVVWNFVLSGVLAYYVF